MLSRDNRQVFELLRWRLSGLDCLIKGCGCLVVVHVVGGLDWRDEQERGLEDSMMVRIRPLAVQINQGKNTD